MKKNMPTTKFLLFFSWTLVVLGVALATYVLLSRGITTTSSAIAVSAITGGLLAATVLRAFANTSQLIYDTLFFLCKNHQDDVKNHQGLVEELQVLKSVVEELQALKSVVEELQALKGVVEQLSCDVKDINQNGHQMSAQLNGDVKDINQNIQQINNFFLKMKCHIETQQ